MQPWPTLTPNRIAVSRWTPVIRSIALRLQPSAKRLIIAICFSVLRTFAMLINVLHLLFGVKCFRVTLILMKYLIAVVALAVCCIVIPVDGQTAGEHPNAHQKNGGKPKETPPNTVNVETVNVNKINVPQQPDPARKPDQDSQKSPSYLHRLIAPEGLPNLVLCLVGIAGVIAAFCTLQEIQATGKQTDRMIKLEQRAWIQTHSPMAVGINALNPIRGYLRFRVERIYPY